MCTQFYKKCRNYRCENKAQLLSLIECANKPNCEIQLYRISQTRGEEKPHCESCEKVTPRQRKKALMASKSPAKAESMTFARAPEPPPPPPQPALWSAAESDDDANSAAWLAIAFRDCKISRRRRHRERRECKRELKRLHSQHPRHTVLKKKAGSEERSVTMTGGVQKT